MFWLIIITLIPLEGHPTLQRTTMHVGPFTTIQECEDRGYLLEDEYVKRQKSSRYGYIMTCKQRIDPVRKNHPMYPIPGTASQVTKKDPLNT